MNTIINKSIKKYTIKIILNNLNITSTQQQNPPIKLNQPIFSKAPLSYDYRLILQNLKQRFKSNIDLTSKFIIIITSKYILKTLEMPNQTKNILIVLNYSN